MLGVVDVPRRAAEHEGPDISGVTDVRAAPSTYIVLRIMEHTVFWKDSAAPETLFGGGVAVEGNHIQLRGSDGRSRVIETVPATELAAVGPGTGPDSFPDFPSIRLDLHNGRSLVLAAALGTTALLELLNTLLSLLPGA